MTKTKYEISYFIEGESYTESKVASLTFEQWKTLISFVDDIKIIHILAKWFDDHNNDGRAMAYVLNLEHNIR